MYNLDLKLKRFRSAAPESSGVFPSPWFLNIFIQDEHLRFRQEHGFVTVAVEFLVHPRSSPRKVMFLNYELHGIQALLLCFLSSYLASSQEYTLVTQSLKLRVPKSTE